jgi:fatty acid desaturase
MQPLIPPRELQLAIKDLQRTDPGPGLRQIVLRLGVLVPLVAWGVVAWWSRSYVSYVFASVAVGLWYAAILMTTHDAVHHTFTGIRWLDELWGRLVSWPVLWCHASFTQIHQLHHRMNGIDLDDPERVDPTPEEIAAAGAFQRFVFRHRIVWAMFVRGAAGLILETFGNAWRFGGRVRKLRGLIVQDVVGAGLSFAAVHAIAYRCAERVAPGRGLEMVTGTILMWLFVERIVGVAMYLRKHAEHSGHWVSRPHFFETQCLSCRNVDTSEIVGWFFSRLNYHSVHHAFPRIPFYHLEEAHRRVGAMYAAVGISLPMSRGYVGALREITAASRLR